MIYTAPTAAEYDAAREAHAASPENIAAEKRVAAMKDALAKFDRGILTAAECIALGTRPLD